MSDTTPPETERPTHLNIDCYSGAETHTVLTDQEWAAVRHSVLDAKQAFEDSQAEEAKLSQLAADHPDPLVQALARKAGVL